MHRGYVALWRKIQDSKLWTEKRVFSKAEAWIDILMEAQHLREPRDVVLGMQAITCHYGECLKSLKTWSKRWRWSVGKVRRFLELLKSMNQICFTDERKTTRITILNYSVYDPRRNANGTQTEREWYTDKNVKNEKHEKPKNPSSERKPCSDAALSLACLLRDLINERSPNGKPAVPQNTDMQKWALHIDRMIRLDRREPQDIEAVIRWCQADSFWRSNIRSTATLREKYPTFWDKMNSRAAKTEESYPYRRLN